MSTGTETKADPFLGLPGIFRECVQSTHETARYDLSTPWIEGDWVYASNGRLAVRTATDMVDDDTLEALIEAEANHSGPNRVAAIGKFFLISYELRPEPTAIPDFQARPDRCESCGGNGICFAMQCEDCDGKGFVIAHKRFEIAPGYWLNRAYLDVVRRHGARLWLPAGVEGDDCMRVSVFRGLGFEGVLMPMQRPKPGEDA